MIVVDTNVIASAFIRTRQLSDARRALERDQDWRVPHLWRSEFLSTLRQAMRADKVTLDEATATWTAAELLFGHRAVNVDPARVLALTEASEFRLSSYDAEFIAVAESLGDDVVVLTQDFDFWKAATLPVVERVTGAARVVMLADYLKA